MRGVRLFSENLISNINYFHISEVIQLFSVHGKKILLHRSESTLTVYFVHQTRTESFSTIYRCLPVAAILDENVNKTVRNGFRTRDLLPTHRISHFFLKYQLLIPRCIPVQTITNIKLFQRHKLPNEICAILYCNQTHQLTVNISMHIQRENAYPSLHILAADSYYR